MAVASGMVPLATASDGGGSIRIPASACGLPGFKPSLGRVPDGGPHPVDWPLVTTRGVITRTVADLIATLDVIVGPEPSDLRSLPAPCEPYRSVSAGRRSPPDRLEPTVGYDWTEPSVLAACGATVERLAAEGVEVVEIDRVFTSEPYDAWGPLIAAYVQRSVGELDRSLLTDKVGQGIEYADRLTARDLLTAEDTCHRLNLQLVELFETCDRCSQPCTGPAEVRGGGGSIRATGVFNLTRSPAAPYPSGSAMPDCRSGRRSSDRSTTTSGCSP